MQKKREVYEGQQEERIWGVPLEIMYFLHRVRGGTSEFVKIDWRIIVLSLLTLQAACSKYFGSKHKTWF